MFFTLQDSKCNKQPKNLFGYAKSHSLLRLSPEIDRYFLAVMFVKTLVQPNNEDYPISLERTQNAAFQ